MSGLLLLCILPEGQEPGTDIARVSARPVKGLTVSPFTLWISEAAHSPVPSLEEVRAHHRVAQAAWTTFPAVLPVRFGQWFATTGELAAAVEPKVEAYREALDRVRSAGEFSIRILDPALTGPDESTEEATGTAYLRAAAARARHRSEADARGRAIATELGQSLSGLVQAERVDAFGSPHGLATVSHLVGRALEGEYGAAADRFAAARPELRFLRTGPWPAWSFTA